MKKQTLFLTFIMAGILGAVVAIAADAPTTINTWAATVGGWSVVAPVMTLLVTVLSHYLPNGISILSMISGILQAVANLLMAIHNWINSWLPGKS